MFPVNPEKFPENEYANLYSSARTNDGQAVQNILCWRAKVLGQIKRNSHLNRSSLVAGGMWLDICALCDYKLIFPYEISSNGRMLNQNFVSIPWVQNLLAYDKTEGGLGISVMNSNLYHLTDKAFVLHAVREQRLDLLLQLTVVASGVYHLCETYCYWQRISPLVFKEEFEKQDARIKKVW